MKRGLGFLILLASAVWLSAYEVKEAGPGAGRITYESVWHYPSTVATEPEELEVWVDWESRTTTHSNPTGVGVGFNDLVFSVPFTSSPNPRVTAQRRGVGPSYPNDSWASATTAVRVFEDGDGAELRASVVYRKDQGGGLVTEALEPKAMIYHPNFPPVVDTLEVEPSQFQVVREGDSIVSTVTSTQNWSAQTAYDWITFPGSSSGGPGQANLNMAVAENTSGDQRIGWVYVISGLLEIAVQVLQFGDPECQERKRNLQLNNNTDGVKIFAVTGAFDFGVIQKYSVPAYTSKTVELRMCLTDEELQNLQLTVRDVTGMEYREHAGQEYVQGEGEVVGMIGPELWETVGEGDETGAGGFPPEEPAEGGTAGEYTPPENVAFADTDLPGRPEDEQRFKLYQAGQQASDLREAESREVWRKEAQATRQTMVETTAQLQASVGEVTEEVKKATGILGWIKERLGFGDDWSSQTASGMAEGLKGQAEGMVEGLELDVPTEVAAIPKPGGSWPEVEIPPFGVITLDPYHHLPWLADYAFWCREILLLLLCITFVISCNAKLDGYIQGLGSLQQTRVVVGLENAAPGAAQVKSVVQASVVVSAILVCLAALVFLIHSSLGLLSTPGSPGLGDLTTIGAVLFGQLSGAAGAVFGFMSDWFPLGAMIELLVLYMVFGWLVAPIYVTAAAIVRFISF